jgi:hypothetical protein
MEWGTRMSARRRLILPVLLAAASAAAMSCTDQSPVAVQAPALQAARSKPQPDKKTGLVTCTQTYDSATKVFGPLGDTMQVGNHILWVDSLSLTGPVTITAVAPAGNVRWVRFQPEGVVFQPGFYARLNGLNAGAALYTNYKDCGVPTTDSVRIAQVSDSLSILGYLQTWVQSKKNPWSQANQWVVGLLPHFSNYAVAW